MHADDKTAVVFLHGLLGFGDMRRLWPGFQYYRRLKSELADLGVPLYFTHVPPVGTVAERAAALAGRLAGIGAERVHLVGHSMGGLDARYLIHHFDRQRRVRSLTTVGTPHRGSALVHWVMQTQGPIQWFARRFMRPGILDLTPEACAHFNQAVPDRADVVYRSWAGCRPVAEMPLWFRPQTRVLQRASGDNDSQVSVESATWGDFRGVLRADHLELIGWSLGLPSRAARRPFDHIGFFRSLLKSLPFD